jgi:RNA polymerase sigma-70 factor (ECF subfamily)
MAKSRDEEPGSEDAPDPSAPLDAMVGGAGEDPMADPPSDNPAFSEIVQQHRSYLVGVAVRLSGNSEIAEDLVQDTFKRALRRFGELRSDSHVRAWLSTILSRLFLDHNKHTGVIERAMKKLAIAELAMADDTATDPIPPELSHAALRDAIDRLEPELREIIECYLADKAYKEIAAELGIPIGTVSSRVKRARDRLRELLTAAGALK